MSKISKACDISPKVRKEVIDRDGGRSILSGSHENIQIAHYISHARLGLGIPQNLVCLTSEEHYEYDNGKYHKEIKKRIEDYLRWHYPGWDNIKLTYSKGGNKSD